MYYVHADKQRNAQTALLNGYLLERLYLLYSLQVEHSAHLSFLDKAGHLGVLCLAGGDVAGHLEVELAYLFLERHARHQVADKLIHISVLCCRAEC